MVVQNRHTVMPNLLPQPTHNGLRTAVETDCCFVLTHNATGRKLAMAKHKQAHNRGASIMLSTSLHAQGSSCHQQGGCRQQPPTTGLNAHASSTVHPPFTCQAAVTRHKRLNAGPDAPQCHSTTSALIYPTTLQTPTQQQDNDALCCCCVNQHCQHCR